MYHLPRTRAHANSPTKAVVESSADVSQIRKNQQTVRYENTYTMSPDENKRFVPYKVEYLIKHVLDAYLHKVKYDPDRCSKLTQDICSIIKTKTKEFKFERYKIIVQVYIGQDTEQSVQMASRCLWKPATDMFATATYRNNSLYAIGVVYGLYLE